MIGELLNALFSMGGYVGGLLILVIILATALRIVP
jgi:hypothetical protein